MPRTSPRRHGAGAVAILCLAAASLPSATAQQIQISEIMFHPRDGFPEFLEITNAGATPYDIAGWQFTDGIAFTFPEFSDADPQASFLQARETIVVASVDEATLRVHYSLPLNARVFGPWTGALDNRGERISLEDKNGTVRSTVEYEDRSPWPEASDGTGHSLVLTDPNYPIDDWRNWRPSRLPGGSPGGPEIVDAEEPVPNPEVGADGIPVIEYTDTWHYHNLGQDLGSTWRSPGYNEATHPGWRSGPAILGFETSSLPSPGLRTDFEAEPGFDRSGRMAYYFRKEFTWSGATQGVSVFIDQIIDDGVVYYLNGQEIGRVGMPSGPVNGTTAANRTVGDGTLEEDAVAAFNAPLVSGINVLAAEVHQVNAGSSDMVFAARMRVSAPASAGVVLNEVLPGGNGGGFVEFYNPGDAPVSLDGHFLSDDPGSLAKSVLPGDLVVPAKGYASVGFAESGLTQSDPLRVFLSEPDGTTIVSGISASVPLDGRSLGRKPAGGGTWFLFSSPTRDAPNQSRSEAALAVRLSEVGFHPDGGIEWVELTSTSDEGATLDGLHLTIDPEVPDALPLSGSIAPGGQASFDTPAFVGAPGSVLLLLTDGTGAVLDAARLEPRAGRPGLQTWPDGSGDWFASASDTRDAPNQPDRHTDIVINEIMCAPPSEHRAGEFIELYNRGDSVMNLSGWEIVEGVRFRFPTGSSLAPGAFLVVAADAAALADAHGAVPVAGSYDGNLSDRGERIRLVDAAGNTADVVDYRTGGSWPALAGGDGSSLELAHPALDNALASAWRASDESTKSSSRTYTCTGTYRQLRAEGSTSDYKELHLNLTGDGHIVIEDIQLRRNGSGSNLIANAAQMTTNGTGASGWLIQGNHGDSYFEGSSLHLVALGYGDNRANRAEIDIPSVNTGDNCTLTFNARWISGRSRLIAQTWDHSFGADFEIDIPENLGSPGASNSRLEPSPPPQIDAIRHSPPVPAPGQPVVVTAQIGGASPPASVTVHFRLDNSNANAAWQSAPMNDVGTGGDETAGDGIHSATVSNFTNDGQIVQFYVRAVTSEGRGYELPRDGAARPAMWVVDATPIVTDLSTRRFIVSAYDLEAISNGETPKYGWRYPRLSNHYKNATVIADEREILYNSEIRHTGSPWTRGGDLARNKWKPPRDQLFRNRTKHSIDNDASNSGSRYNNRMVRYWLYLLGHPENEGEFVQMIVNGSSPTLREEVEPVDTDLLRRHWGGDGNRGELYRIDDEWWFRDDWNRSQRDADWRHKGTDEPIRYHTEWMKRTRAQDYDYSALIDFFSLVQPASGSGTYTQEQIERYLDADAVALMAAVRGYAGDWDSFTLNRGKNGYLYRDPDQGLFRFLWWDSDLAFQNTGEAIYNGMAGFRPWIEKPYNMRRMNYYLAQMLDRFTRNSARVSAWFAAEEASSNAFTVDVNKYQSWFAGRESRVLSHLGAGYTRSFDITSGNGSSASTTSDEYTLAGNAPHSVYTVVVDDHPEAVATLTGTNGWSLSGIRLKEGVNTLAVHALDKDGNLLASRSFTVTKSGTSAPVPLVEAVPSSWRVPMDQAFALDASASYDPEGGALTYAWSLPPEAVAHAGGLATPLLEVAFARPGIHPVALSLTDPQSRGTTLERELTVVGADGFSPFTEPTLESFWSVEGVVERGNVTDHPWYSLQDEEGRLMIQIPHDQSLPLSPAGPSGPWIHRTLVPITDGWAFETELRLETTQFGAFQAGLLVEFVNGGAVARHWLAIDGGHRILSSSGASAPFAGGNAGLRVREADGMLVFQKRDAPGSWATIGSIAAPPADSLRAGLFVATSAPEAVRVTFDFAALVDPSTTSDDLRDALRITELHYAPPEGPDLEFIELTNISDTTIDLAGVRFEAGRPFDELMLPSYLLAPGAHAVVVADETAFRARYGDAVPIIAVWGGGRLDNAGEPVTVRDAAGNLVHDFTYGTSEPWPSRLGSSLEVVDPDGDYDDPSNWRAGSEFGGSPGTAGSAAAGAVIAVNEILSHTDPPLSDSVELVNLTDSDVDIGGWYLSDSVNHVDEYRKFRIPDGTRLAPGGRIVFDESDFNPTPGNPEPHHFALDGARGEDVHLVAADAGGELLFFADSVRFGPQFNARSFGRWPDGTGDLLPMAALSLGERNAGPRIGPVLIAEIQYAPATGVADHEFVELRNVSGSLVDLSGWRLSGGVELTFDGGTAIPPGGSLVVVPFPPSDPVRRAAFEDHYGLTPGATPMAGGFEPARLDNAGESLTLLEPDDPPAEEPSHVPFIVADAAQWAPPPEWPDASPSSGHSLHRLGRTLLGTFRESWTAAPPSPGTIHLEESWSAWSATHLAGRLAEAGPNDDPDHDGLVSFVEYQANRNPNLPDAAPPLLEIVGVSGDTLTLHHRVDTAKTDLLIEVEAASALEAWTPIPHDSAPAGGGLESRTVILRPAGPESTSQARLRIRSR